MQHAKSWTIFKLTIKEILTVLMGPVPQLVELSMFKPEARYPVKTITFLKLNRVPHFEKFLILLSYINNHSTLYRRRKMCMYRRRKDVYITFHVLVCSFVRSIPTYTKKVFDWFRSLKPKTLTLDSNLYGNEFVTYSQSEDPFILNRSLPPPPQLI